MALAIREFNPAQGVSERHLVTAVRRGDDRAFELLFERYRRRIGSYVYGLVRDAGRAEDVTQEIFISALRRLRATERPIAFKPWIYEIARNACIDEYRRSARASLVSLDEENETGAAPPAPLVDDASPDVQWERKQQLHHLLAAFSGLSDTHHRMLVMRELEGLSYDEIGESLGMSRAMVESTLFRARRRLSAEFDELSSGRQCELVRAAIDGAVLRAARRPGIRERRRVSTHLGHCHACVRHARAAGLDESFLRTPSIAERVAGILPIGSLPLALRRLFARHPTAGMRSAAIAESGSSVAVSRAIAATAAVVVAGGAIGVAGHAVGHSAPHTQSARPLAAARWAAPVPTRVALPLNVSAALGAEPMRTMPAAVSANLVSLRAAMLRLAAARVAREQRQREGHRARRHHAATTTAGRAARGGSTAATRPGARASGPSVAGASGSAASTGSSSRSLARGRGPSALPGVSGTPSTSTLVGAASGVSSGTVAAAVGAVAQTGAVAGNALSHTGAAAASAITQTGAAAAGVVAQASGAVDSGVGAASAAAGLGGAVTPAGQAAGAAVQQTSAAVAQTLLNTGAAIGQVAATTDSALSAATSVLPTP